MHYEPHPISSFWRNPNNLDETRDKDSLWEYDHFHPREVDITTLD